jgi:integrase
MFMAVHQNARSSCGSIMGKATMSKLTPDDVEGGKHKPKHKPIATAKGVEHAKPGVHSVAGSGNLYLQVRGATSKSWVFRYSVSERDAAGKFIRNPATGRVKGRTREMGLGSYPTVSLGEARELAAEYRKQRAAGVDPLDQREQQRRQAALERARAVKFKDAAQIYFDAHRAEWRSAAHAEQWLASFKKYVHPVIGDLPVQAIGRDQVLKVLQPVWSTAPETARRIRGRLEAILDAAQAMGHIAEGVANPARWKGHLDHLLARQSKARIVKHHAALPYAELPAFMAELREQQFVGARALEFTILTAARTGEALGARWSEIDVGGKVWVIPAERMKGAREHRVPLSRRALQLLAGIERSGDFVFEGRRAGRPPSRMAMLQLLERMGRAGLTAQGFRSTFRDWAAEQSHFANHVVEMALAHSIGSAVEAAYRRGDLIEQRRQLMEAWDRFCSSPPMTTGDVIPLRSTS